MMIDDNMTVIVKRVLLKGVFVLIVFIFYLYLKKPFVRFCIFLSEVEIGGDEVPRIFGFSEWLQLILYSSVVLWYAMTCSWS
jgi:hypothetical protein